MIHIITVHFKTDRWVDLQLKQIDKHVTNYKIWSYCDGFDISPHVHKFHFCENFPQSTSVSNIGYLNHIAKLNSLTHVVLSDTNTREDDLLIWLDSDSFPISDMNVYISKKLSKYPLIAINRPENGGDVIPHPSFTCTTVYFWKEHNLNWSGVPGSDTKKTNKQGLHDPGGFIYKNLLSKNLDWFKLLRT